MQLHYEMMMQADADQSITQTMFQYINKTQICNQMNTNTIITQNQHFNELKLEDNN